MKIVLLGLSGSGKSTVARMLADHYKTNLYEADDEVELLNGGNWPDNDQSITNGFLVANEKAIHMNNVVYVISWMEQSEIKDFYDAGFIIVEMHADFDELVKRKKERDNIVQDKINKFELTYVGYLNSILLPEMREYYNLSIDTTKMSSRDIFNMIVSK